MSDLFSYVTILLNMADNCSDAAEDQRFVFLSNDRKRGILLNRNADNTRSATKTWIGLFNNYLKARKVSEDIKDVPTESLPDLLEDFFPLIRIVCKGKTEKYKNTSLKAIRAAINRYLKEERGVDTMSDPRFTQVKEMFRGERRYRTQRRNLI